MTGFRFSYVEIYMLVLMPLLVLMPAWAATREFGQPLIYGVLAQRAAILIIAPILIFLALRLKLISARDIEATLLLLAWGTCGLYGLMYLLLNPANFISYGLPFVMGMNGKPAFVLRGEFIGFGLIYYAFRALRERRARYYMAAAVLLIAVVSIADARAYTISLACMFLYYVYRWRPMRQFVLTVCTTFCAISIALGLLYAVNPDYVSARSANYLDAFRVVFSGSKVKDVTAEARLLETLTALPYIQEHPLLGNGIISNQWERGTKGELGTDFYAADIGLIGVVYDFGLLGLLVLAYQFKYAIRAARRLPDAMRSPLADACIGFLLLCAINSFASPIFAVFPEVTLFFIAVLVYLASEGRERFCADDP
jgi:hypothetical protein